MAKTKPTTAPTAPVKSELKKSSCPKCGCTDHTPYHNTVERQIEGVTREGQSYNLVVWRRTACIGCGQHRSDRSYELRSKPKTTKTPVAQIADGETEIKVSVIRKKSQPKKADKITLRGRK